MDDIKVKKLDDGVILLIEWSIFVQLDRKTDLEFILLKGHLILENILRLVLERNNISEVENYSFYRKIIAFEALEDKNRLRQEFIVASLKDINRLRNKIAHEFNFDITNGEFEIWSTNILNNLKGEKFSKYTYKTKIFHSFSMLAKNILEM